MTDSLMDASDALGRHRPSVDSDELKPVSETMRLLTAAVSFWAVQLLVLCIEFGFRTFHDLKPAFLGLLIAIVSGGCLARVQMATQRRRIAISAGVGLGLTAVQLASIGSFVYTPWLIVGHSAIWSAVALGSGAAIGGALSWAEAMLLEGWGKAMAFLLAGSSFALIHLALVYGVPEAIVSGFSALTPLAMVCVATFAFVAGLMLRDSGRLASAPAIARRERFRVLAEALPIPVVLTTQDHGTIIFSNRRSKQQFDIETPVQPDSLAAPVQENLPTSMIYVDPRERERLVELLRRDGEVENFEVEMRHHDGSTFWCLVSAQMVDFNNQTAVLAGYYDISDRKAAEEALVASEVRYALISRASNDGIFDWDIPSGTVYYSTRWKEIAGIDPGHRLGSIEDWLSRVHPEDIQRLRLEIADHHAGRTAQLDTEYRLLHDDGRYCWMQCRAIALRSETGEPIRMAGSQSDITLRKTYERNLINAAYEDRLTGISNRAHFSRQTEECNSPAAIAHCAVILFNIDQFRRFNDNLGNGAGDALLIGVARRLTARMRSNDTVARLGGDEFAVWLQDVRDLDGGRAFAETLLLELEQPYALGDIEIPVTLSAGMAFPALGEASSGMDLVRNARLALDQAKQQGGGRVEFFESGLLRETHLRRRLSKDLTAAERQGQITCVYQPIFNLLGGDQVEIAGFESLMRWQHPELGAIGPARFIPIAEEAGLIGPLGLFAIENAAREIDRWSQSRLLDPNFSVAVNLSARQISDRAGVFRLLGLLDRLTLPRGRIKLEITESVLMSDPEAMVSTLQQLRERGIELSLDDFGTGFSSLSYLHRFPLDGLKIDRSFVSRMTGSPEAYRLVRSIIELAHDLGLKVVAEGVENIQQVELLRGLGCDCVQGYYFSVPLISGEAEKLLLIEDAA